MWFIKGALLLALCLLVSFSSATEKRVDRSNTCSFAVGDVFQGTYTNTTKDVKFVIGWDGTVTEVAALTSYDTRFSLNGTTLSVMYVSSGPVQNLCTQTGQYTLSFSNDCGTVSFAMLNDPCATRAKNYAGLQLNKVPATCKFSTFDTWVGIYPGNNPLLSGKRVEIRFGGKSNDINETSAAGTIQVLWGLSSPSRNLLTRDLGSQPSNLACQRSVDEFAIYSLSWSRNCSAVQLRYIDNDCPSRRELYDGLYLTKVTANRGSSSCRFLVGDSWIAQYAAPFQKYVATFQFGDMGTTMETSSMATREGAWMFDPSGDLIVKDTYANPMNYTCGTPEGKYNVDWNADCSRATLTTVYEGCDFRRQLYSGVTLYRLVPKCNFYPYATWFGNFQGRDPVRSGVAAKFQFGENFAVQENFTGGYTDSRFQLTSSGLLYTRWFGSMPVSGCSAADDGLYLVQWSRECTTAQLHVIHDNCTQRQNLYDSLVINKAPSECAFISGQSFLGTTSLAGIVPANALANFTLVGPTTVNIQAGNVNFQANWLINDFGNLEVTDTFACGGATGIYTLVWSPDCRSFALKSIDDSCASRVANFESLVLTLGQGKGQQCRTIPGTVWTGVYPGRDPTFSGRKVTIEFGSDATGKEVSSVGSIAISWYNNGSGIISVGEFPELSSDESILCPNVRRYALYTTSWDNECTQLTLGLVTDGCSRRRETYNGLVLSRVAPSTCDFFMNEEWRGTYTRGDMNATGVTLRFGALKNQLTESTDGNSQSWANHWSVDQYGQVQVRTFSASPAQEQQGCDPNYVGIYTPVWTENCNRLTLWTVFDPCWKRAERYEQLTVKRMADTGPACTFKQGDIWSGNFSLATRPPYTGAPVSVQFTDATSVFMVSYDTSASGRWFIDPFGYLNVRDVASRPSTTFSCDYNLAAQYNLEWSWDCNSVELTPNFDACERRRNRLTGLTLRRELTKCASRPGDAWDGVVAGGKYSGQVVNVTLGTGSSAMVNLPSGAVNSKWTWDKNNFLNVVDGRSPSCLEACSSSVHGLYSAVYSNDCNTLSLTVVSDGCTARASVYDGLVLYKRFPNKKAREEVIAYETETEIQFNFGGMIPPLPCCAVGDKCKKCGCCNLAD